MSLDYLKTLDNQYSTGAKLRTKHITFVSHERNLLQTKGLSLYQNSLQTFGSNEDIEMSTQIAAADEDSKASNNAEGAGVAPSI